MKNQSKTLIFFGNERILSGVQFEEAPVFSSLINEGYEIAALIVKNNETKSRKIKTDVIIDIANTHQIPVYVSPSDDEINEIVSNTRPEAAILVAYGKLISQRVIDTFPKGIINIHPSSLPRYRGSSPIETAISNGDSSIGVSVMALTSGMDSGPIYIQDSLNIESKSTKYEIGLKALKLGSTLLIKNLPKILDGSLKGLVQDESQATFTSRLNKVQSKIDLASMDSAHSFNLIKSLEIFPRAKLSYKGVEIIVVECHTSSIVDGLSFKCSDGKYITVDKLIAPSGKTMNASDFMRGYSKS